LTHVTRALQRRNNRKMGGGGVNVANCGNPKQEPTKQKEKRMFCRPVDAEKWCGIHCTTWHDLEECITFLDHKKIPKKPVAQEPR
jgi:hypothetical protein